MPTDGLMSSNAGRMSHPHDRRSARPDVARLRNSGRLEPHGFFQFITENRSLTLRRIRSDSTKRLRRNGRFRRNQRTISIRFVESSRVFHYDNDHSL